MLTIDTSFYTYAVGPRSQSGLYTNPSPLTSIGVLSNLRRESEKVLKTAFTAATIDTSGGKAITISGGSLARPVDVVLSHWHDTSAYQSSLQEFERGITILNKRVPETVDNLPFLHIKRNELAILAETQRHLDFLACNHEYAKTLKVPDESRIIFNSPEKLDGLNKLSIEMDNLVRDVTKEQNALFILYSNSPLAECRAAISSVTL